MNLAFLPCLLALTSKRGQEGGRSITSPEILQMRKYSGTTAPLFCQFASRGLDTALEDRSDPCRAMCRAVCFSTPRRTRTETPAPLTPSRSPFHHGTARRGRKRFDIAPTSAHPVSRDRVLPDSRRGGKLQNFLPPPARRAGLEQDAPPSLTIPRI